MANQEMLDAVKDYAQENAGNNSGWCYVSESWDDEDIFELIKNCKTFDRALDLVSVHVGIFENNKEN